MKFRAILWASAVVMAAAPAFAQRSPRTVTNMDLEKYKQQRLKAEKDYAENYERMGFPSPDELQKQNEKSRVEREQLSARLTAERMQREQAEAELAEAARASRENVYFIQNGGGGYFAWPYGGGFFQGSRFPPGGQINWSSRIGNGQPVIDYFGPRTATPRPRVIRPRRR